MQNANKFTGFVELSGGLKQAPPPPPKTRWTAKEVEQIRSDAYNEGLQSAQAKAAEQAAQAFDRIAASCTDLHERLRHAALEHKTQAADLSFTIGRKLAGAALDQFGEETVRQVIAESLIHIADEPAIQITVPAPLRDSFLASLGDVKQQLNITAEITVEGSDDLAASDCILKWTNGGMERSTEEIEQEIDRIINERLAADRQAETQLDLFGNK